MLAVKAVAFGVVAAAAGVITTIVLRTYVIESATVDFSGEVAEQNQKIAELQTELDSLSGQLAPLANEEQVIALANDLETGLSQVGSEIQRLGSDSTESTAALGNDIEQLRAQVEELGLKLTEIEQSSVQLAPIDGNADPETANQAIAQLQQRLDALAGMVSELDAGAGIPIDELAAKTDVESLAGRLEQLESIASQVSDDSGSQQRLAQLELAIAELAAQGPVDTPAIRSMVLIGVRAAVETGAPYKALLQEAGLTDAEVPGIVMEHAASGVATLDELQRSFGQLAREAIRTNTADDGESSGGVMELIGSLVQVRPLSPQEGTGPAEVLSRAEASLAEGDLDGTLATLGELPPSAQAVFTSWIAAGEARLSVLAALYAMLGTSNTGP